MPSFNKVILLGNLTRDPDSRQTQSGTVICRFTIAVNRSYTSQDGTLRDEACFIDIECFGRTAENVAKYFGKGKPILVEGRLRQDTWEDKTTNQKRSKLVVVLERFEFVGGKNSEGGFEKSYDYESSSPSQRQPVSRQRDVAKDDLEDDDVPF
mgnify:FL=1